MTATQSTYQAPVIADLEKRLIGMIVDAVVALVLAIPVMVAFGIFEPGPASYSFGDIIGAFAYNFAAFSLVQGYFLATSGQTIGKKVIGTRIVEFGTDRILPLHKVLLVRYLPRTLISIVTLLQLINIAFIFGERRQCLHDKLANTQVVDVADFPPAYSRP